MQHVCVCLCVLHHVAIFTMLMEFVVAMCLSYGCSTRDVWKSHTVWQPTRRIRIIILCSRFGSWRWSWQTFAAVDWRVFPLCRWYISTILCHSVQTILMQSLLTTFDLHTNNNKYIPYYILRYSSTHYYYSTHSLVFHCSCRPRHGQDAWHWGNEINHKPARRTTTSTSYQMQFKAYASRPSAT